MSASTSASQRAPACTVSDLTLPAFLSYPCLSRLLGDPYPCFDLPACAAAMATTDSSCAPASLETAPAATKWLLGTKQGVTVADTAVKLFCVPQAGMGAWIYQNQAWSEQLAPQIQVMAVFYARHTVAYVMDF